MKAQRKLSPEDAEKLLPEGEKIHYFSEIDGDFAEGRMSRQKVLERFRHNVELSGDVARGANHGVASYDDRNQAWYFFETRRT